METEYSAKAHRLVAAAAQGDMSALRQALADGADVKFGDNLSLRTAAMVGHMDCLEALVDAGGDVGAQFNEALFFAAKAGDRRMVDYLLDHGADADIVMKFHDKKIDQATRDLLTGRSLRDSFEKAKEDQAVISQFADSVRHSGLRLKPRPPAL